MRVILTVGISASGKTTWANDFVKDRKHAGESWRVLSRDDIRMEILKGRGVADEDMPSALVSWDYDRSHADEMEINDRYRAAISEASLSGCDGLICADTNLDGGTEALRNLASCGIDREQVGYRRFDVDMDVAKARNENRRFAVAPGVLEMQSARLEKIDLSDLREMEILLSSAPRKVAP